MELQEFIKKTLIGIVKGVENANDEYGKSKNNTQKPFRLITGDEVKKGAGVQFDLAVTTKKEGDAGASASISVIAVDITAGAKGKIASEEVNRIKFTVKIEGTIG